MFLEMQIREVENGYLIQTGTMQPYQAPEKTYVASDLDQLLDVVGTLAVASRSNKNAGKWSNDSAKTNSNTKRYGL